MTSRILNNYNKVQALPLMTSGFTCHLPLMLATYMLRGITRRLKEHPIIGAEVDLFLMVNYPLDAVVCCVNGL